MSWKLNAFLFYFTLFFHPAGHNEVNSFLTFRDTTLSQNGENERALKSVAQNIQLAE